MGASAGANITGNWNIDIENKGAGGESNTIRIGEPAKPVGPNTMAGQLRTFIAGIRGAQTGNDDAIPVVIDSFGQLGTASSSARFKAEIKPMDKASEAILALKPVTFHYKANVKGKPHFGLIAEDVAKVNPDLVVRDTGGQIYTVRYEAVNAMLLDVAALVSTRESFRSQRRSKTKQAFDTNASTFYAAETGGAVSGFRVSAITSGRKGSSRGTAVFDRCFG